MSSDDFIDLMDRYQELRRQKHRKNGFEDFAESYAAMDAMGMVKKYNDTLERQGTEAAMQLLKEEVEDLECYADGV